MHGNGKTGEQLDRKTLELEYICTIRLRQVSASYIIRFL